MPTPADTSTAIVTLAEVRAHLNYADDDTSDDAELLQFALAATEVAEEIGGIVREQDLVEYHDGGNPTIVLQEPATAVVTVVEYLAQTAYALVEEPLGGTAYSFYGFTVDGPVITRRSYGSPIAFMPGRRNVVVTYKAGAPVVLERVKLGVKELVRHWFQWGQQTSSGNTLARGGYSDEAVQSISKMGYAIPNRVVQLLAPQYKVPGIG